ncbi:hypothetical protein N7509_000177 [Penicillium cosmopolitanum]|uniref:Uncharacterized protein n=1 Tax=Penicillium cosmopolitanum TaxID=1131564 RepID=A0A9X0BF77_9EURO|nr:uncharacterized protein N7509_000177 [Penicillium cosmopolitanum]KAJ5414843.1 hypothetical protein N7509_000177 [Penicillium cosmopolitanum]
MSDKIPNPLYTDEARISRHRRLQPEGRDSSLEMKLCSKPRLHSSLKGERSRKLPIAEIVKREFEPWRKLAETSWIPG